MTTGDKSKHGTVARADDQAAADGNTEAETRSRTRSHQGCLATFGLFGVVAGLYQACTAELSGGPITGWSIFVGVLGVCAGLAFVWQSVSRKTQRVIRKNRLGWWDFINWS